MIQWLLVTQHVSTNWRHPCTHYTIWLAINYTLTQNGHILPTLTASKQTNISIAWRNTWLANSSQVIGFSWHNLLCVHLCSFSTIQSKNVQTHDKQATSELDLVYWSVTENFQKSKKTVNKNDSVQIYKNSPEGNLDTNHLLFRCSYSLVFIILKMFT